MSQFVGAVDQGTTSTRFILFDQGGNPLAHHQLEHQQIMPRAGWVEHDPLEIWQKTQMVIREGIRQAGISAREIVALGVTNQRETTVIWDPKNGLPWYNAIVWQDTRTEDLVRSAVESGKGDIIGRKTGLRPATYFSGSKIQWILRNVPKVREAVSKGEVVFGNTDSWVIWNLTGGADGGSHVTDVTNASRTMLMDLASLSWDQELLDVWGIPDAVLPEIRPSSDSEIYGSTRPDGPANGEIPVCGDLGDQQAATVGQACFQTGDLKNTYGTGNFMLLNTGADRVPSRAGLLTTMCYQIGKQKAVYALEGSIAVTGAAVQWLRDQLGIIRTAAEVEDLARQVENTAGLYFVPAFSGLFAPYWRPDARGTIVGLSRFHTRAHLARAALEAICYQTRDVLEAMVQDAGVKTDLLKVDGGATVNDTLMQLQADILGIPVIRPAVTETTSLGAAYAAGLAVGFWQTPEDVRHHWKAGRQWDPRWSAEQREEGYANWKKAVERTFGWT